MSGFKKYMKEGGSANEWASNLPSSGVGSSNRIFKNSDGKFDDALFMYPCCLKF